MPNWIWLLLCQRIGLIDFLLLFPIYGSWGICCLVFSPHNILDTLDSFEQIIDSQIIFLISASFLQLLNFRNLPYSLNLHGGITWLIILLKRPASYYLSDLMIYKGNILWNKKGRIKQKNGTAYRSKRSRFKSFQIEWLGQKS